MTEKKAGKVIHYYKNIKVAIVKLNTALKIGDEIKFSGKDRNFTQTVESMEVEHKKIKSAKKGQELGIKVAKDVKKGDLIYKLD